ncbi:hypothetical protein B7435_16965 [Mycolicibacterium peregrinum]|uniref:hypothetical protein n=1 Tax=Mycolicibacterium peregrinum TaxID=43304 RepID=UPI000B4B020B|nr:hypothetical protein [Mycolicibacterium peregrinum]OWM01252.1 hypothetical protein B7435_16965 [Mycolicibacterium peregrinum]
MIPQPPGQPEGKGGLCEESVQSTPETPASTSELTELLTRVEELDSELEQFLTDSPVGPVVKHPLVFSIPHVPHFNALANARLREKQKACAHALETHNWSRFIYLHERPYRPHAFAAISTELTDESYWEHLSSIWTDAENIVQDHTLWTSLLKEPGRLSTRHLMMNDEERKRLDQLPDEVTVYRGVNHGAHDHGMSWTADPAVAHRFALRFGGHGQPQVLTGRVRKSDVIAYLHGRNEDEILLDPEAVTGIVASTTNPAG